MRIYGRRKPLIVTLTSPGFIDHANEPNFLKRFLDNLRKNYGLDHYVWVREYTKQGYPHFHFICVCDSLPAKELSGLWASYFGVEGNTNSVRLGTKPTWNGKRWIRRLYVNSPRMARYLAKYIGKDVAPSETRKQVWNEKKNRWEKGRAPRIFAVSEQLAEMTEPCRYTEGMHERFDGRHERVWIPEENPPDWMEITQFNPHALRWWKVSEHSVYFGTPKHKNRREQTEKTQ